MSTAKQKKSDHPESSQTESSQAEIIKREDVPVESTWDSTLLFESWDAWEAERADLLGGLSELGLFQGRLSESPTVLADWMELYSQTQRRMTRLMVYVWMSTLVDTGDTTAKAKIGQIMGAAGQINSTMAFAEPELMEMGETLLEWAKNEPVLEIYHHYFDDLLRQQAHVRSAEVEQVLGMLAEPFGGPQQIHSELTNTDLRFEDAVDSQGTARTVGQATIPPTGIQGTDRERRRTAWESYADGHRSMQNTLAATYLASVKQAVFSARVRGYDSVLDSRLSPYNLPTSVFHNLIETFQANLPVWHRYWAAKRKALGVKSLHPYDIWAPLVAEPPAVPYAQAVDWIAAGMTPLSEEYVAVLRRGCLQERWVDYAPNTGKRQGASSMPCRNTPPFLWLSYDDTLNGVSVLAHELGHSMHHYFFDRTQPTVYGGITSMSVAETASNFNQVMLRAYLTEEKADDEAFQLALIDETMFNFHRYFFLMPTLARFEQEVYSRAERGEPMNAESLNQIMAGYFAEGYGDTMTDDPERTALTWSQFGHLYSPFYTFQYAVGISAAHALARPILGGDKESSPAAAERYMNFLKAGTSLYPMELFEQAGVDMSTPQPVIETFTVLEEVVTRLESLVS